MSACFFTPLCPAGHLPLTGGDQLKEYLPPSLQRSRNRIQPLKRWRLAATDEALISPREGEMSGRCPNRIER
jgi:hypothetical protein